MTYRIQIPGPNQASRSQSLGVGRYRLDLHMQAGAFKFRSQDGQPRCQGHRNRIMKKLLTYGLAALLMTVTALAQSLHRIKDDVLAAYSKEDFSEMMAMYAIKDTDAVKKMVSEGKVVGLRKGRSVFGERRYARQYG